jgi:transcriptional regulator with XRE-family HTH domain
MPRVPKQALPPLAHSEETIGQRIAQYRKLRGLTQRQLADRIGIVQNLVSDYENGKLRLYDEMVARFATALRVSSDEILGLSKEDELSSTLSLRFVKRLSVIETFPEAQKKRILRNLDDAIAASKKDGSSSQNSESKETTTSIVLSGG